MRRIIDLTATLGDPGLPVIPFFPDVLLERFHVHEIHGRSNTKISMPVHVGTHIDAPYHFVPGGITVDKLPLEKLVGEAVRLDIRKVAKENTAITLKDIQSAVKGHGIDLTDRIAVVQTGWAEKAFYQPSFYTDNPFLGREASQWLVGQDIKALALDHPIDAGIRPESRPTPGDSPNHRLFLGNGIPLIENLVNLELFDNPKFEMVALPMKISGCDGAPARIIAIIGS